VSTDTLRAEVVAQDGTAAERFQKLLQDMHYVVHVRHEGDLVPRRKPDLMIYHVSESALAAERRSMVRPREAKARPRYWLESLWLLHESAPTVPIIVAIPPSEGAADKALNAGATDVIEENVTPTLFRRRIEMVDAFRRAQVPPRRSRAQGASEQEAPRDQPAVNESALELPLPELGNERSGRLDAQRVASYLGIPLRRLADAVGLGYAGVHKTPDSPRVQEKIRPVVRVLELANRVFGNAERVRTWLNRPLAELEDESPLAVILAGEADAVETLLVNALTGIPV
jgi:hypothetical protein